MGLEGAYAKLNRARNHLNELLPAVNEWQATTDQRLVAHKENGGWVWRVELDPPDVAFSLIVGDIIHNTRTALDHLVAALVREAGHERTFEHAFPVVYKKEKWGNADLVKLANIDQQWRDIIRSHQPFEAADLRHDTVHVLATLSNTDKHSTIVRGAAHAGVSVGRHEYPVSFDRPIKGSQQRFHNFMGLPVEEAKVFMLTVDPPDAVPSIDVPYRLPLGMVFGDSDARIGHDEFHMLIDNTERILRQFDTAFL